MTKFNVVWYQNTRVIQQGLVELAELVLPYAEYGLHGIKTLTYFTLIKHTSCCSGDFDCFVEDHRNLSKFLHFLGYAAPSPVRMRRQS